MKISFAAVLALGLLVPSAAFAKSTDRNEDMHIDSGAQSGTLTGDGKTVLSQGVIITQGTLDLRSSEAEIYLKDGEAVRVVAGGPVGGEPLLVQVGFTRFALRRSEAARIRIRQEDAA